MKGIHAGEGRGSTCLAALGKRGRGLDAGFDIDVMGDSSKGTLDGRRVALGAVNILPSCHGMQGTLYSVHSSSRHGSRVQGATDTTCGKIVSSGVHPGGIVVHSSKAPSSVVVLDMRKYKAQVCERAASAEDGGDPGAYRRELRAERR